MTARAAFRQADVTRAAKGLQAAGISSATIRLRPGEILIHIGSAANETGDVGEPNEWDEVLNEAPPAS